MVVRCDGDRGFLGRNPGPARRRGRAERVRAVEVLDGGDEACLREQQDRDYEDRDYEACLREDREEERRNHRKQKREEAERQRNRPGLAELRQRRLRFYDFQNRRVTRSAAKRMNYK